MPSLSQGLEQQLRLACAELERRLQAGESCRAEELLARCPELAAQAELAQELIYAEFVTREELGQTPTTAEYLERFPQWRLGLQEQLQVHALLQKGFLDDPAATRMGNGVAAAAAAPPAAPRRLLGQYEILEEIGHGSAGLVYKARHPHLNRLVALKVLLAGPHAHASERGRFRTEAEAIARLKHANIVQIYDVGETDSHLFLTLEYLEGGHLGRLWAGEPQRPTYAAELVQTLAQAIDYAHRQGIVHRDLKPANVLLAGDGTPKISDFGLAKLVDHHGNHTQTGSIFGTPGYMAPEQAAGQHRAVGPAADVYALGAILYEALTGRPPFRADSVLNTLRQVLTDDPVPPDRFQSGVPADLATICMKCLHKEPARRYASAGDLADDLGRFRLDRPILARPASSLERSWKWARRQPAVAALLMVTLLSGLSLLAGSLWYNARLSQAVDDARLAARDADEQRAQAQARADIIQRQLDYTRRSLLTIQLGQVEEIWRSDSARALHLLEDAERCPPHLRDFAWGMYYHLCKQDRTLPAPHQGQIHALALSADGRSVATAGSDGRILLHDLAGGRQRWLLGHTRSVSALAFSPDGKLLASGGGDRGILLWLVESGERLVLLAGHTGNVNDLAFSPDGKLLASASADRTVRTWIIDKPTRRGVLAGHRDGVQGVAFSPDGLLLASVGHDQAIRLWEPLTGQDRGKIDVQHAGRINALAFAPDGKRVVLALPQKGLLSYALAAQPGQTPTVLHPEVNHFAYSPDGRVLAAACADHTVKSWDTATGAELFVLKNQGRYVRKVAFSPDGQYLASISSEPEVRLTAIGQRLIRPGQPAGKGEKVVSMVYAPDGQQLAAGHADGSVTLWDAGTLSQRGFLQGHEGRIWSLAFSPDGRHLATASDDHTARIWDVIEQEERAVLRGHRQRIWAVAYSPDGQTLATAGEDGSVRLWDAASGTFRSSFMEGGAAIYSVAYSPDGQLLATATVDGLVRLRDAGSLEEAATLKGHDKAVLFTVFSPDGKQLVTGGLDYTVRLWDVEKRQPRFTLLGHTGYAFSAHFTPDGQSLATGSGSRSENLPGEVKIWDVETGHSRATLNSQTGPLAFAPDGKTLATIHRHAHLVLWQAQTR